MRKKALKIIAFTIILFLSFVTFSQAQTIIQKIDLTIFPLADKGYKKMIIEVPHSDNDKNKKIEFTVGKWMEVDGCNTFNLAGSFEKKDVQGWGYHYYVFNTTGNVASTMMGCPNKTKRNLFVSAQPETVGYNGRMPIVIYVPDGYDAQFKIYSTDGDTYRAAETREKKQK